MWIIFNEKKVFKVIRESESIHSNLQVFCVFWVARGSLNQKPSPFIPSQRLGQRCGCTLHASLEQLEVKSCKLVKCLIHGDLRILIIFSDWDTPSLRALNWDEKYLNFFQPGVVCKCLGWKRLIHFVCPIGALRSEYHESEELCQKSLSIVFRFTIYHL